MLFLYMFSVKKLIYDYIDKPLSYKDIQKYFNGNINIYLYNNILKYNDIFELLKPYGYCIILYQTSAHYGHWVCVLDHPDRVEFFDPYNIYPDDEFKFINNEFRIKSGQKIPYLTLLLYKCNKKIEYNNYKFQQINNNISTCGRHAIIRILLKHLLLDDYYKLINNLCNDLDFNPDELVTFLTI